MKFILASLVVCQVKQASIHNRNRLDLIREEIGIPWEELNKIGREVVGREIWDVRELRGSENLRLIRYLQENRIWLAEKHKIAWFHPKPKED